MLLWHCIRQRPDLQARGGVQILQAQHSQLQYSECPVEPNSTDITSLKGLNSKHRVTDLNKEGGILQENGGEHKGKSSKAGCGTLLKLIRLVWVVCSEFVPFRMTSDYPFKTGLILLAQLN